MLPTSEWLDAHTQPVPRDLLFVNEERTVPVRLWASGTVESALRDDAFAIWGPPIYLAEER